MGLGLGLAPATLEFWVRFPNERKHWQGKQAHPVLKYRVPHGSQPRPGWAPDPLMVGIRSPDGLVVGSCTSHPGVLGSIPKREEPGVCRRRGGASCNRTGSVDIVCSQGAARTGTTGGLCGNGTRAGLSHGDAVWNGTRDMKRENGLLFITTVNSLYHVSFYIPARV